MVVGMNTGGGFIQVAGDFDPIRDFKPSYMAFDITEPRNPKLLWEKRMRASASPGRCRRLCGLVSKRRRELGI